MCSNEDVICISSAYTVGYLMIIIELNLFYKLHFLVKTVMVIQNYFLFIRKQ
jgi:hypothetical protein